ncbi:MAG: DUF853 family protein, partial [Saprospiraceae bacterium]|nr:DUF853 family protein [Saprospiraceae bacterium]
LTRKMEAAEAEERQQELREQREKARSTATGRRSRSNKSTFDKIVSNTTTRQIGRTIARELTRGLLGALGLKR